MTRATALPNMIELFLHGFGLVSTNGKSPILIASQLGAPGGAGAASTVAVKVVVAAGAVVVIVVVVVVIVIVVIAGTVVIGVVVAAVVVEAKVAKRSQRTILPAREQRQ